MYSTENEAETQDPSVAGNWHVLYTRHQHEKSVAEALSNNHHDVFLPLVYAAHRWQDRTKRLWLPLFPCYVFIRGGFDRRTQILSTPGVIGPVTCAGRPAIIPRTQMDAVRRVIDSGVQVEAHPFLRCGDQVRVIAGPLHGIEGIMVRMKSTFRLIVSIDLLGRSAAVEIDNSSVEAVNPSPVRAGILEH